MGWKKKIGIGIVAIFAILIVLGIIGSLSSNSTTQHTGTLITNSVDEMLPTRADIPTEFKIQGTKNVTLNKTGFDSGKTLSTDKLDGSGMIFVDYSVYKFSTTDDATSFYNNTINTIKQEGGYTEISISGCFAYKVDMGISGEDGESICQNNNVVYIVGASSAQTFTSIDSFMNDGTNLLNSKI